MEELDDIVARVARSERGRVQGALLRLGASLDAAEEAFQEAVLAALERWGREGVPERPGAWLTTVAKNRARDARRRRAVEDAKAPLMTEDAVVGEDTLDTISDDYLRLVLTCCHPEVSVDNRIALTLKVVCGFEADEIARAFMSTEATVSQRILRAKQTIEAKRLAFEVPSPRELAPRLEAALGVVYAMYNEGHTSRTGALMRLDLQAEALRLARLLCDLSPRDAETFALLALVAFGAARARARVDGEGRPVLLDAQDRSAWDRELLGEGLVALRRSRSLGGPGPYALQATIAACHVTAPRWEDTDWPTIVRAYDALLALSDSPVVALNRAIALAMRDGPEAGLRALEPLGPALERYHHFFATRAQLLERLGRDPSADLERALSLVQNDGERRLLDERLAAARSRGAS